MKAAFIFFKYSDFAIRIIIANFADEQNSMDEN
jgi:hypothetical protein